MKPHDTKFPGAAAARFRDRRSRSRGVALIITLILLALLGAASLAIVLLVSSDTMINGFYRDYRGSFYAADSGANVVIEAMKNAIQGAGTQTANPPLTVGATAIPTSAETLVSAVNGSGAAVYPTAMTNAYAAFQNAYYTLGDTGSWNGRNGQFTLQSVTLGTPQFELQPNDANTCLPVTAATCAPSGVANNKNYAWTFYYPYTITVQGRSSGSEAEEITESGTITYNSISGTAGSGGLPSFSKYAAFITNFGDCQGPLVPGTMTGPFFTDGQWNFGNFSNPGYTFTDSVAQVGAKASWWGNRGCSDSTTAPKGFKAPTFPAGGLQLSQNTVTPPSDSYSQLEAVLDGQGTASCANMSCQTLMNQELKTVTGTQPPASGSIPNGVYIPWFSGTGCSSGGGCFGSYNSSTGAAGYAGGFYIQGDASITLQATTAGNGANKHNTQTYTITQGSTVTTIVVDNVANGGVGQTTVTSGGNTLTLQGAPAQVGSSGTVTTNTEGVNSNVVNPTLVYVNGNITGLTGTYDSSNNPLPAIQDNVGVMVVGSRSVSITGDLTYNSSPVSVPADTLNTSTQSGVLGVYTLGNINLYPDPNGNLTVNGSLAALSGQTGSSANSGFETPGGSIGTWTIVGGRAEDHAHSVSIGAGNTYYDRRFANNFGPPWFPTAVPTAGSAPAPASSQTTVTRTSWAEVNRQ